MSLKTDIFFHNALQASEAVLSAVGDRIFNTARPTIDEDEDKIPYIIIAFDGLQNNADTKDDGVEGTEDRVTVSILCVTGNRQRLATLAENVRKTCIDYWNDHQDEELTPIEWQFSASQVQYDPDKPCCYQILTYQCITKASNERGYNSQAAASPRHS